MSDAWLMLWLRTAKMLGVALLFAGVGMAMIPEGRKKALPTFGVGFLLTWALGFVLLYLRNHSFLETWIWLSMLLSFVSLQGVLYLCGKESRGGPASYTVAILPLVLVVMLMTLKIP